MNVKELKDLLQRYPDDMQVFMDEWYTEFTYGLVNSLRSKVISFYDDSMDETPLAEDHVLILSEQ